jgi:hypothetical protein
VSAIACASESATAGPLFTGLGDLPANPFDSEAWGVSGDGSTAVGQGHSPGGEAFTWSAANGMQGLGGLPATTGLSTARGGVG